MQSPVEDFHCALQKKICLQGRLYLFQQHVCFYSNLFGFVKSKVIPLQVVPVGNALCSCLPAISAPLYLHPSCHPVQDVISVSKRKNVGFPNSIEITWQCQGRAKHDFFTSFLHRREAYKMVVTAWANCRSPSATAYCGTSITCSRSTLCVLSFRSQAMCVIFCLLSAARLVNSTYPRKANSHRQAAHVSLQSTEPRSHTPAIL